MKPNLVIGGLGATALLVFALGTASAQSAQKQGNVQEATATLRQLAVSQVFVPDVKQLSSTLAISPNGNMIAIGDGKQIVRVLNGTNGTVAATIQTRTAPTAARFSRDGKRLAIGTANGTVYLATATSGQEIFKARPFKLSVADIDTDQMGQRIVAAGGAQVVILDASGKILVTQQHPATVTAVRMTGNGMQVASASGMQIAYWTVGTNGQATPIATHTSHRAPVVGLVLAADGSSMVSADAAGHLKRVNPSTAGTIVASVQIGQPIVAIDGSSTAERILVGTADRLVLANQRLNITTEVQEPGAPAQGIAISLDGRRIASGGGILRLANGKSGALRVFLVP